MAGRDALVQARIDLTAALRSASRLGLAEGVCNHFSVAAPGLEDRFLINPQGLHWSEVTPADLLLVDGKGTVVEGRHTVEPTAFFIHGRLHRSKRKPAVVLHTHMPFATALTLLEGGRLEPASQNALKFYGKVGYDEEYNGLVLDNAEGDRIAARLRGRRALPRPPRRHRRRRHRGLGVRRPLLSGARLHGAGARESTGKTIKRLRKHRLGDREADTASVSSPTCISPR